MIYIFQNVGCLLDPVEDILKENYIGNSVLHFSETNLSTVLKSEPFFSDKWLLIASAKDVRSSDVKAKLLGCEYIDLLIHVDYKEDLINTAEAFVKEINEIKKAASENRKYNNFLSKKFTEEEKTNYLEKHLDLRMYSSYNLTQDYIKNFIVKYMFHLDTLKQAQRYVLDSYSKSNLLKIVDRTRGNESKIKSLIDLYGADLLRHEFIADIEEFLPKPKYVNAYNFPLQVFSGNMKKRRDVYNIYYNYSEKPKVLYKTLMEFFDQYEKIYGEYISGRLSVQTKLKWYQQKGKEFKITSEYKFEQWWKILETISLERITMFKYALTNAKELGNVQLLNKIVEITEIYLS